MSFKNLSFTHFNCLILHELLKYYLEFYQSQLIVHTHKKLIADFLIAKTAINATSTLIINFIFYIKVALTFFSPVCDVHKAYPHVHSFESTSLFFRL